MPEIIFISDTHLTHPQIPDFDILVHCGDICARGTASEFLREMEWFGSLKNKHKIFIPGNHDRCVETDTEWAYDICRKNGVQMLIDQFAEGLDAQTIYGSPWTPEFCNWAFMLDTVQSEDHWSKLPDTHILVTHGPPYGILDRCPHPAGSPALLEAVKRTRPSIHVFGHIHEGAMGRETHVWDDGSSTQFVNASCLDAGYRPVTEFSFFIVSCEKS